MLKLRHILVLLSVTAASPCFADGGFRPLTSTSTASISVTSSSSTPTNANNALQAMVCNIGTVEAFVAIGGSTVVATTSGMSFPAGFCTTLQLNQGNYLAAITASSTTTLRVTFASGNGPVAWSGSGGGGGGGLSVTDQAGFTQGSSQFTPGGGVFNDTATLSSGQEGTYRMTTKRAQVVDVDTSGNALYSAITAPLAAGSNTIGNVNQAGTWTVQQGNTPSTTPWNVSSDPCQSLAKSGAVINLTASGQIITGTAAKKTYICSIDLISATAQNIALVEGTGTVCATNIFGLAGGTTAATGWNLSANGGLTKGSGSGTVYSPSADANATAANVCILLSSTGQTSGQITYVQQ